MLSYPCIPFYRAYLKEVATPGQRMLPNRPDRVGTMPPALLQMPFAVALIAERDAAA